MANDLAAITARIADELNRTDLSAQITLETLSAIRHYEREREWFEEGRAFASTVTGQPTLAVPDDLIEIDTLTITYSTHPYGVTRRGWDWYRGIAGDDTNIGRGPPTDFAYYANQLWLYPVPDQAYTLTMAYLKQPAVLSDPTDSNNWTSDGEEVIRLRARQAVKVNYLTDPAAMQEMSVMAAEREPYYSHQERIAHHSLVRADVSKTATNRITPSM